MSVEELQENFKKLTLESSSVMEANDKVEALSNLQGADRERMSAENEGS